MRLIPILQRDKLFMKRVFGQEGSETRPATVAARRLDGSYTATINGTTVGNLSSAKGDYEPGTKVMVHSYNQRTNDYIAAVAPTEDSSTQAAVGFEMDATNYPSLL